MFGGLCVKGSGAIDHIIPAFPVPLNLIMSLNQPIITKCQRSVRACVCWMCVWNFRVTAAVNIWAPTWDELNKLFNLSTDAYTCGTPLTTLINRWTAEWKWNGGNCLDYGCFVILKTKIRWRVESYVRLFLSEWGTSAISLSGKLIWDLLNMLDFNWAQLLSTGTSMQSHIHGDNISVNRNAFDGKFLKGQSDLKQKAKRSVKMRICMPLEREVCAVACVSLSLSSLQFFPSFSPPCL